MRAATGAALLALLLLAPLLGVDAQRVPTPTATTPTPPPKAALVVTDISVVAPQWVDGQARNGPGVDVTVRNAGELPSGPYTLEYTWVGAGLSGWLNGDQSTSTDAGGSLNRSAAASHHAPWRLQPGQAGAGAIVVTVSSGGDKSSAQRSLFVPVHNLTLVAGGADVVLRPGETRFVTASIVNQGNVAEPVTVALLPGPASDRLDAFPDPPLAIVPPQQTLPVTLYVLSPTSQQDPAKSATGAFALQHTLQARAGYGAVRNATSPTFSSYGGSGGYAEGHLFDAQRLGSGTLFVPAGGATASFRVTNLAASAGLEDTYHVTATADPGWEVQLPPTCGGHPAGWAPALERPCLGILPSSLATLDVRVRATGPTPAGTLTVTIASDHGQQAPTQIAIPLRQPGPGVTLPAPPTLTQETQYAGDTLAALVPVANQGDKAVPLGCALHVTATTEGAALSGAADLAGLAPGAAQSIPVALGPVAAGGTWRLEASLVGSPCASQSSPVTALFFVHVAEATITRPDAPPTPTPTGWVPLLSGAPGETVGYRSPPHVFVVRNTGNAAETFGLHANTDLGAAHVEGEGVITLAPGESRSVPVAHDLPRPAGRLSGNLTLVAALIGRPVSWLGTVRTLVTDRTAPTLQLAGERSPTWDVRAPYALAVNATDDTGVRNVTLRLAGPRALDLPLHRGAGTAWTLEGLALPAGNYTFTLRAWDLAGRVAQPVTFPLTVRAVAPPSLRVEGLGDGTLPPGGAVSVHVEDELKVSVVTVRAEGLAASAEFPVVDGVATVNLTRLELPPGSYTIRVVAVNLAGAVSDTMFTLTVPAPPAPQPDATGTAPSKGSAGLAGAALLGVLLLGARRRRDRASGP
ncbi:MAG TPA: hypothetical protein VM241_06315 [Candidatus Thermoplasmatota archaeon]|nr:hypothetical protein [Candidatus Thermoplasmatota archaeon]